jgi:hypothetical protein
VNGAAPFPSRRTSFRDDDIANQVVAFIIGSQLAQAANREHERGSEQTELPVERPDGSHACETLATTLLRRVAKRTLTGHLSGPASDPAIGACASAHDRPACLSGACRSITAHLTPVRLSPSVRRPASTVPGPVSTSFAQASLRCVFMPGRTAASVDVRPEQRRWRPAAIVGEQHCRCVRCCLEPATTGGLAQPNRPG